MAKEKNIVSAGKEANLGIKLHAHAAQIYV